MVEKYCSLADYLQQRVVDEPNLEMMSHREWTNVCFRYNDSSGKHDLNKLNIEIRNRLIREGEILVSRSNIHDDVIIRPVISNPSVDVAILDGLIEKVNLHASEIISGIPPTN
jgi:glutamate/tyrosine decarboxylase-like PLP-dependent enzyme